MTSITAVVLTLNEEVHIAECLDTLTWADARLVFDSFSTDRTVEISREKGARVIQHPFENYGAQRNAALDVVSSEWVLFVDADERITPELAAEVQGVLDADQNGWWVPRHNYIFGRLTLRAGWYPDHQMRLLRVQHARYDADRPVHEEVILAGAAGYLQHPIIHYNYRDVRHFISVQERYSELEAKRRFEQGQRPRLRTYITMPARQFLWRFITLKGWCDGFHGLRLSLLMAYYEFWIWRRVRQMAQQG